MRKLLITLFIFLTLMAVIKPILVMAQGSGGAAGNIDTQLLEELKKAGEQTPLSEKDPRLVIADIVKTLLSLLGIIFLVLTVYAGFLWMTAAGDPKQVDKAKDIIKMAVIGLAVILLAYSITLFVTYWLQVATVP